MSTSGDVQDVGFAKELSVAGSSTKIALPVMLVVTNNEGDVPLMAKGYAGQRLEMLCYIANLNVPFELTNTSDA